MRETNRIHFVQMPVKKPCPFCGNTDQRTIALQKRTYGEYDGKSHPDLDGKVFWYVECFDCDAKTGDQWDDDCEVMGFLKEDGFMNGGDVALYMWNLRKEPNNS